MANKGRIDILLQGNIITIQATRTAPVGCTVHHVVGVEHIWQTCQPYSKEEARVGIVGRHVIILLVETVNQRQTAVVGAEGIDKVLRWFVEVATAIGHIGNVGAYKTIRPVEVAVCRTVVTRILYSPYRLTTILILLFRTEIVVDVSLKAIAAGSVDGRV